MKKLALIICTILTITSYKSYSQSAIYLGARGGLNIPKLTASGDNPMSKGYSSRLAGNGGVFAEFQFSELFSLRPMIEFTQQGGSRKGMQAIPVAMMNTVMTPQQSAELASLLPMLGEKYLYADFKSNTKFNYLMVPILANFSWKLKNIPLKLFVNAGPFISFLLNAKQDTKGSSFLYVDPAGDMNLDYVLTTLGGGKAIGEQSISDNRAITDEVNSVNIGVSANIGGMYEIAPRHNLLLEVGGNYGFRKLQKSAEIGENRIGALTLTVGYAYQLK